MATTAEKTKAEFQVGLETDQLKAEAESAAGALEHLKKSIDDDSKALANMQKAMRNLQSGTVVNVAQFKQLQAQIDAKKASIASAQGQYIQLGGSFKHVDKAGGSLHKKLAELGKAAQGGGGAGMEKQLAQLTQVMQGMPGPLSGIMGHLGKLRGLMVGGAIALGIAAVAAAIVALTAAALAAVVALTKYGVAQADAARSEKIRLEGLAKLRFWYQKIPGDAGAMQAGIDRVAAKSALSRGEIVKLNEQLYRLGFRGENLALTLNAAQKKMSVQGDEAAQRFIGWASAANMAGESVKKLADRVEADIGGLALRQLYSLDVQSKKLNESMEALFADLGIEQFLKSLFQITQLFSQSTESGNALKQLLEHALQPIIDGVTKVAPLVKRFFQGLIIAALDFEIAVLDIKIAMAEVFGGGSDAENEMGRLDKALKIGKLAFWALGVAVGIVGVALYGVYATMRMLAAPLIWLIELAMEFWDAWTIGEKELGFFDAWKTGFAGLAELGSVVIDGIMLALDAGLETIGGWFDKLGSSIVSRFKKAIKAESPSKLFADAAVAIPQGVVVGIERGAPAAEAAVEGLIPPPDAAPAGAGTAPAATGRARAGGSATVNIGELHVHASSSDPQAMALDVRRELESILQSIAFQLGTEPEGAPV